jgi:hypothetical protein
METGSREAAQLFVEVGNGSEIRPQLSSLPTDAVCILGPVGADDANAETVVVYASNGNDWLAHGTVSRAEQGSLPALTGLLTEDLANSVALSNVYVNAARRSEVLPVVLYLLLRRARIWGRTSVMSYVEIDRLGGPDDLLAWQRLEALPPLASTPRVAIAQRLDIAIHKAFAAVGSKERIFLQQQFFVPEVVETLELHVERFFSTAFFKAVHGSTLSREQYIYSISNLHQFVRWTTRLVARAVGYSHDEDLRNHYLEHLSGEINHEKIIERDLTNLGADVDYVVNDMLPNVFNQEFMLVQESVIGFHQDPVLFLAAPFAAEGIAARLDGKFILALEKAARGWGIANPKQVTSFLASHIHFDGGEDGHWEGTRKILARYLDSDHKLQKFINLVHLAMNAFERSYASYIHEQKLFSAVPTPSTRRHVDTESSANLASL